MATSSDKKVKFRPASQCASNASNTFSATEMITTSKTINKKRIRSPVVPSSTTYKIKRHGVSTTCKRKDKRITRSKLEILE